MNEIVKFFVTRPLFLRMLMKLIKGKWCYIFWIEIIVISNALFFWIRDPKRLFARDITIAHFSVNEWGDYV